MGTGAAPPQASSAPRLMEFMATAADSALLPPPDLSPCISIYMGAFPNPGRQPRLEGERKRLRMAVKLIGAWPSPFVMRPRIALNLKGVEYEFLEETFGSKSELLLKSNPVYKKIPVLLHGDKPICESLITVEYIDATWCSEAPILPKDPYSHATARFWAYYIDDKWFPSLMALGKAQTEEEKVASLGQLREATQLLEGAFEKCSQGKAFFGGDGIGYLDIALGCYVGWIKVSQEISSFKILDEDKTPLLCGWVERFCTEDAVKGVMPETDKLMEFWKGMQAKLKAAST